MKQSAVQGNHLNFFLTFNLFSELQGNDKEVSAFRCFYDDIIQHMD